MQPSTYQQAIFDFVATGHGNAIINAVAGSGKTTTVVEALKLTQGDAVFLAFNKAIAEELKARVPSHVQARTFHSLCYGPVTRALGVREVNTNKLRNLVELTFEDEERRLYGAFACKLVGLARQEGVHALVPDTEGVWADIVAKHNIELDSDDATIARGIELARKLLEMSNGMLDMDFDDMLYFAVLKGIKLPTFDWVFVDEAQDTNAIQRAILRKILRPRARLVAVGDPAQAIYGFRGADGNSLQLIREEFKAAELPLSVSYRCAKSIVDHARQYVPIIQAHEHAVDGVVRSMGEEWNHGIFSADDLVVCRNTKPLVALAYSLLRERIPCHIMGRDIGEGLKALVRRMKARDIDALQLRLEAYKTREMEKAIAKGEEALAAAIEDKVDSLLVVVGGLPENARTVAELLRVLDEMFSDAGRRNLTLATIHKSKGLEADHVFWLNPSVCPSKWAKQPWQQEQERNLMYVAITRAKSKLTKIELPR